ncbi:MAG: HDOD domain-containing protein [Betaproteobacteria bacterium]
MPETSYQQLFLGRQPILGREQQLFAYELFFRSEELANSNRAEIIDPTHATSTVITNVFAELSISDSLGPYRGFINIDHDFLFSDVIEGLPKALVAFEIPASIIPTSKVVARCLQLSSQGFMLVADEVVELDEARRPLLALADIIKVDISRIDAENLTALVSELKPLGNKLLAEKVESAEQLARCQNLGFDLFQGYYFATPTLISGKKLNPSQLVLIRLLALVMEDADTTEIENAFKLEPGLAVNMLRLTNSVSCGLSTKITSLRHAITILGRRQLQRWLQLLTYTNPAGSSEHTNPLLQLAATRGRLMELLAEHLQARNREFSDQAFMVGIMSLMPALLGMGLPEILEQLPVTPRVKLALIDHSGQHGQLLRLVEVTEQTDSNVIEEALHGLPGINADVLGQCLASALSWANNLGRESVPQAVKE